MGFPPAALNNQQRILQSRFPPARGREEEDVRSNAGSTTSWVEVPAGDEAQDSDGLEMPPAEMRLGSGNKMDPIPEHGPNAPSMAPPQLHTAAPVTQAARNFVDHTNEPAAAQRLRRQQEMAQRKGKKGARFVQLGAHNACNIALPPHIQQVGSGQGERSIMVLDHRDLRLQSPFQGWLLDEILTNAGARINIQSDARLVRSPTTGYHCNMFMLKTLDNFKLVIAGSMTSYGSVPCGKCNSTTHEVLSHDAFQPFRWPVMRNDSPTWVDFKIKLEGHLLVHLELRGYRSDQDMSVQINHVTDSILWLLQETAFIPTCVVTVFQGWRVCACSWEVGGRIYAISEGGIVVALDYPLCHMEIRLVATSSADAFGQDADRLEFMVDREQGVRTYLDQECQLVQESHGKDRGAGSGIAALAVGFDPCSLDSRDGVPLGGGHRTKDLCNRSRVQPQQPAPDQWVPFVQEAASYRGEGCPGCSSARPCNRAGYSDSSTDHGRTSCSACWQQHCQHESSHRRRGGWPVSLSSSWCVSLGTGSLGDSSRSSSRQSFCTRLHFGSSRRTLDQRRSETVDFSAMTPSAFVDRVKNMGSAGSSAASAQVQKEEITIEFLGGSLDGSGEGSTPSQPRSYGPPTSGGK